jgi:hypothetical protein
MQLVKSKPTGLIKYRLITDRFIHKHTACITMAEKGNLTIGGKTLGAAMLGSASPWPDEDFVG